MFNEITKKISWGGDKLTLSTGKIARQADGAILASIGQTQILCTVSISPEVKGDVGFLPLSVHYREMSFAAAKIPGGFIKKEGKPSDKEIITARLIDRAIRPLFDENFFNEIQIICTVLSYDPKYSCDLIAMIGAYAALAISGAPVKKILGAARVALIKNKFVLNPSVEQMLQSDLDLIVSANNDSVMMVEAEGSELSCDKMLEAIEVAIKGIKPLVSAIEELQEKVAKPVITVHGPVLTEVENAISKNFKDLIIDALSIVGNRGRVAALTDILSKIAGIFTDKSPVLLSAAFEKVKSKVLREWALDVGRRIDGRKLDEIRAINCQVSLLHRPHGSAMFTRGDTQVLGITTLGSPSDEQIVESLDKEFRERFMLHYIFPPYAVNETSAFKAPGRRETGHGRLALRAIKALLPNKEEFPYTIRSVAEVTECDGSSSMATICSTVLSLFDCGVPLKSSAAGIAMGLIKQEERFVILSDIVAAEDYIGDMDFKVAGTKQGITALQMDVKIDGITIEIIANALAQAQKGINYIISKMNRVLAEPRQELKANAPVVKIVKVSKDKIKDIIGPGGKNIREICEKTGSKIEIAEDGSVKIFAIGQDSANQAAEKILEIGVEPEIGTIYEAKVMKILDSGLIVKFFNNKETLIHVNDIFAHTKGNNINEYFKVGDTLPAKFIGYDSRKRYRLSLRTEGIKEEVVVEEEVEVISEKKYFN